MFPLFTTGVCEGIRAWREGGDRCGDRRKDQEVLLMFYLYTCSCHEFFVLVKANSKS